MYQNLAKVPYLQILSQLGKGFQALQGTELLFPREPIFQLPVPLEAGCSPSGKLQSLDLLGKKKSGQQARTYSVANHYTTILAIKDWPFSE